MFCKAGIIEKENEEVCKEITLVESICTDFDISYHERNGKWGIWMRIGDGELLINPIDLVSSLYRDDTYIFTYYTDRHISKCHVNMRNDEYSFRWSIQCGVLSLYKIFHFKFADYIKAIREAINALYHRYTNGSHLAYNQGDCDKDSLRMCCKQLLIPALTPSYYKKMAKEVLLEELIFHPAHHEEQFRIGIGDRTYTTFLSDWDNSFEGIRNQFEMLIFNHESEIKISFDTSYTIISIKFCSILDQAIATGNGTGFTYKDYALVKIYSNEFANMPIIAGYCDRRQVVKTLYEGLLGLMLQYSTQYTDITRAEAYNMIKSPKIEQYIRNEHQDSYKASIRQVRVKDVVEICPDYDQFALSKFTDGPDYSISSNGEIDESLYDKDGNPIVMPHLKKWKDELNWIVIASEAGIAYEKDWENYHARGLAIAKELREKLSSDFDLWYSAPFEDKSGTIPRSQLILENSDL